MGERRILIIKESRNNPTTSLASLLDEVYIDAPPKAYNYCVL
jgi:hypothetical protein